MLLSCVITASLAVLTSGFPHNDYFKLFNPQNYLEQLPSLSLPYLSSIPIPSMRFTSIKPTPVVTTKVINVVTKYVSKTPVCLKISGYKPPCEIFKNDGASNLEYLVTKEYFVRDPESSYNMTLKTNTGEVNKNVNSDIGMTSLSNVTEKPVLTKTKSRKKKKKQKTKGTKRVKSPERNSSNTNRKPTSTNKNNKKTPTLKKVRRENSRSFGGFDDFEGLINEFDKTSMENLEPSENKMRSAPVYLRTPNLSASKIKDLLIEDRLDQLEDILPYYTRKRVYQTSTITVTKLRDSTLATATLLVKNCVPQGMKVCPADFREEKKNYPVDVVRFSEIPLEVYG